MNGLWLGIGLTGQALFASRFAVQWIMSERAGRSFVPVHFWFLSIVGSLILLIYAIRIREPVFILGQSFGVLIYARNLALIRRETKAKQSVLFPEDAKVSRQGA